MNGKELDDLRGTLSDVRVRQMAIGVVLKALLRTSPDAVELLRRYQAAQPWTDAALQLTEDECAVFERQLLALMPPEVTQ